MYLRNQRSEEPRAVAGVARMPARMYLPSLFTLQHSDLHMCLPTYFDDHPAVIILNPAQAVIPRAAAATAPPHHHPPGLPVRNDFNYFDFGVGNNGAEHTRTRTRTLTLTLTLTHSHSHTHTHTQIDGSSINHTPFEVVHPNMILKGDGHDDSAIDVVVVTHNHEKDLRNFSSPGCCISERINNGARGTLCKPFDSTLRSFLQSVPIKK